MTDSRDSNNPHTPILSSKQKVDSLVKERVWETNDVKKEIIRRFELGGPENSICKLSPVFKVPRSTIQG